MSNNMGLYNFYPTKVTMLTLEEAKLELQKCIEAFCNNWKPDWPTALTMDEWYEQFEVFQLTNPANYEQSSSST
jgi:hypothetical protein